MNDNEVFNKKGSQFLENNCKICLENDIKLEDKVFLQPCNHLICK